MSKWDKCLESLRIKMRRKFRDIQTRDCSAWEKDYKEGRWNYLNGGGELPRYAVIDAWRIMWNPSGKVLDLGCGEGIVLDKIHKSNFRVPYVGIDISQTAIEVANGKIDDPCNEKFICAGVENYSLNDDLFDIILFNEMLYYFPDCCEITNRYYKHLSSGGCFIVSVTNSKKKVWNTIYEKLNCFCEHATYVQMLDSEIGWFLGLFSLKPLCADITNKIMAIKNVVFPAAVSLLFTFPEFGNYSDCFSSAIECMCMG